MSARIIPFRMPAADAARMPAAEDPLAAQAGASPAELRDAVDRLEQLDHDLQVQAHRISLTLGEVRRAKLRLLKRISSLRSA